MKKIRDLERPKFCQSPSHNPPSMISLPDGVYEHTCPKCGAKQVVVFDSHKMSL